MSKSLDKLLENCLCNFLNNSSNVFSTSTFYREDNLSRTACLNKLWEQGHKVERKPLWVLFRSSTCILENFVQVLRKCFSSNSEFILLKISWLSDGSCVEALGFLNFGRAIVCAAKFPQYFHSELVHEKHCFRWIISNDGRFYIDIQGVPKVACVK
jgi:hypothetical protein